MQFFPFRVERSGSLNTTDAVQSQLEERAGGGTGETGKSERRSIDSIDSISHGVGGYCAAAVFVRWGNVSCRGTERSRGVKEDEGAGRIAQERET